MWLHALIGLIVTVDPPAVLERWRVAHTPVLPHRSSHTGIVRKGEGAGSGAAVNFAYCSIPKNGCSRWRRLLRKIAGYDDYLSGCVNTDGTPVCDAQCFGCDNDEYDLQLPDFVDKSATYCHSCQNGNLETPQWCTDPAVVELGPRQQVPLYQQHCSELTLGDQLSIDEVKAMSPVSFVFVRDPLARLLSGYLDKAVREQLGEGQTKGAYHSECIPPEYKSFEERSTPEAFAAFVMCWTQKFADNRCDIATGPNLHFMSQSCLCGLDDPDPNHHYSFPVEELDDWYSPLVKYLGIVADVKDGWKNTGSWPDHSGVCFYDAHDPSVCVSSGADAEGVGSPHTGATSKEAEFFADREAQKAALAYFQEDCHLHESYCTQFEAALDDGFSIPLGAAAVATVVLLVLAGGRARVARKPQQWRKPAVQGGGMTSSGFPITPNGDSML